MLFYANVYDNKIVILSGQQPENLVPGVGYSFSIIALKITMNAVA